jgi:RNA polymerase sigma factor (sigma-70 family)
MGEVDDLGRTRNIVAKNYTALRDYDEKLNRFNAAEMYEKQQAALREQRAEQAQRRYEQGVAHDAQEAEKTAVNREQRTTLKQQGVQIEPDAETGIVQPARDALGKIQFQSGGSPEEKQVAVDTELHVAARNAMGQRVYEAARDVKNTVQDINANGTRLAKLQQELRDFDKRNPLINEQQPGGGWLGSQFRAGPSETALALRKRKSDLQGEIAGLTKKGYPEIPDFGDASTALKSLNPDTEVGSRYMSAREAHKAAAAEKKAWTEVAPKKGGEIEQLIEDRTADVLAAGGDPAKDHVLSAIRDRRKELGIPEPTPEEEALKADPVYGPMVKKAQEQVRDAQGQVAPLQTRANKLLSRLEKEVGFQSNPLTADQGDPDARLGLLRAYTDRVSDPAQRGKVRALLSAIEPTLAQLRQGKAELQPVLNAHDALRDEWSKKYAADNATDFETRLSPAEETKFQQWKSKFAPDDSGADYDLRGAFKAGATPDPKTGHWPDTFKKPNHPTFSNESIYAKSQPDLAGRWEGEKFVPPKLNNSDPSKWSDLERQVAGLPPKAAIPHANILDLFGYKVATGGVSAIQGLFRMLSRIASDDEKRKVTDGAVDALEKYKRETLPKYYGVTPEDEKSTAGKVTGAAASVFDMAPGPAVMISKMASAAYANGYDQSVAKQKESGETDAEKIRETAHKSAAGNVAKMVPVLIAYAAGGKIAGKAVEKLAPEAGAVVRGLLGTASSTTANLTVSAGTRAVSGEPIVGDLEQNLTDAFFGVAGGTHEAFRKSAAAPAREGSTSETSKATPEAAHAEIDSLQASERVAPEQVEQTQHVLRGLIKIADGQPLGALTTAERVAVFKSPTPDGMPRVEMIRGEDGKQKPVISEATLQRIREIAPTSAQLLPKDEASQRQAILSPQVTDTEPVTGKQIDLRGMGKGVSDNLYETLWNKLQKGDLTEGGKPSGLLQRARDEIQVGTVTDQQQLRDWAQSGAQPSPTAKRSGLLSKVLQRNGVDEETARAFANKFVADRGADEPAYDQRDAVKEAFAGAGGKFTEGGERDPAADQANRAVREKIQRVGPRAGAYEAGSGKEETGAAIKQRGATVVGETRGVRPAGGERESAPAGESAQTAEQTATKPELAERTHVDDSIDTAFEARKADFKKAGIDRITESDAEGDGALGVRPHPDGTIELVVNRRVAREWFDKLGPEQARERISKGIEEEYKHAVDRRVAHDNGTDTATLYRDWAKKNPDQEKILADAYGSGWSKYSDDQKSSELARMILQTRSSGKTTEQTWLGPERAAAVDSALKQFKEPVRLTERLQQHLLNVLEYLRGIPNPSKAILDHIREVERFESELQTTRPSSTLAMARPDSANSAHDREQARIDGAKLPIQRLKDAMPLAERIASSYRNISGVDVKDVAQHARIALARASKAFDSSRGVPFQAFARVAINNELRGLYRKQSKIAEQTTLDEPLSAETSETRGSQLLDEGGRSPSDEAAYNEGIKVLHEAIDELPAKMRTVMTRLAAGDDPGVIARDLDIAKQGVSNLKIAALRRLRGKLGEKGISGIDDDGIVRMAKPEPSEIPVPIGETPEEKRSFRRAATRLVPGLNVAKDIKTGIQSLLLPTAQSPEHVRAAVDLGRPLGEMHHRQEVSAYELKPDWKAFEKLGVHREDIPLTENAGIKFMSDMSQGRTMTDAARQSRADRIDAMFIERLDHLEKAGAPLESVRENYFPGMWTRESREAFNQAMGEFREAGKLPDDFDLNAASAELKTAIKARTDELLESGQGSAKDMLSYLVRTPMKGRESFRKRKVFDDIMTAVEFGLRPISNNPADLVMGKLGEMDKSIMANQAFRTWEKKGQLVAFDNSGRPMKQELRRNFNRDDWARINDKYGTIWHRNEETGMLEKVGERWARKPVADIINNYLSSSLYNNRYFGKLYTGWMATANALNQSQLGWGSAFHAGFTTMEAQVSAGANLLKDVYSVMRGTRSFGDLTRTAKDYPTAFAKTAITGDKVLNAWRNPDGVIDARIAQVVRATELAGAGFRLERGMKTEQTAKVVSDWFSGNKVRAAMRSPIAFTELLAKPIMEHLVPRQKAGVFAHLAWRIIEQNPGKAIEDLAPEFRDAWNRVDARLGQVRYDRLFANNTAKNVVQALVRAPGWTGGTIAELGGAFKDSATFLKQWQQTGSLPKDVPDRVAYSLSLLVTAAAMNGALTYAFTGTAPQGKDFLAFRDGGVDEAGNPTRLILPSYLKDIWAYATHPLDTLLHKSHPLLSIFGDLIQNKDYYGVQVRDPEANALTQALQSGLHVVKAFTPFWIRGVTQAKTPTGKALPLIGVMPAPKSMTATPAQGLAYELHKRQYEGLTKTRAEAEKTKLHSELIKSARSGDTLSVRQAVLDGRITRSEAQRLLADARLTPFQSTVHKLPLTQALRVFDKGTDSEKEELRPVLQKRNEESHKRGDIGINEYVANKTALAGSSAPQTTRPVLRTKPVMPRPRPTEVGQKKVSEVNLIKEWKRAA